jgi:hypothetical protein
MNRTFGNVNENGDGSTKIQQGVHLYSTLLVVEFGPEKQTEAQINGGAVKRIDHIVQVNPEIIIIDIQRPCLLDENLSEVGINVPVSFLVGIGKSRPGNWAIDTGVIQFAGECSQAIFNITEAFPACELSKTHDQKMLSAGECSHAVVALVMIDTPLELIFWHKIYQLCKDCFSCIHFRSNNRMSEIMISSRKIFKPL